MHAQANEITRLLTSWQQGDKAALDRLVPLVRRELDLIARRQLHRQAAGNLVQPSSLVQELFVRLLPDRKTEWQNREHFFAVAAKVMRHVLVDYARERHRQKRGGAAVHIRLDATIALAPGQLEEVIAIDLALQRLAEADSRKSEVFEMRFFGGLAVDDVARALGIAPNTVIRDWKFARAWLRRELSGEEASDLGPAAEN